MYVAALPCKCTQRIMHVKPLTFCAKKQKTLFRWTFGIKSEYSRLRDLGYPVKDVVKKEKKSAAWMD